MSITRILSDFVLIYLHLQEEHDLMEINVNSKYCFSHCRENLIGSSPPRYRHPAPSHDHLSPSRDHQTRPRVTIRTEEDEERPDSPDYSILGRDKQGTCVSTIYTLKEKQIKEYFSVPIMACLHSPIRIPIPIRAANQMAILYYVKRFHTARSPIRIPILTAN